MKPFPKIHDLYVGKVILGTEWLAAGRLPVAAGLWWLLLPMLALGAWLYARDGRVARPWRRR